MEEMEDTKAFDNKIYFDPADSGLERELSELQSVFGTIQSPETFDFSLLDKIIQSKNEADLMRLKKLFLLSGNKRIFEIIDPNSYQNRPYHDPQLKEYYQECAVLWERMQNACRDEMIGTLQNSKLGDIEKFFRLKSHLIGVYAVALAHAAAIKSNTKSFYIFEGRHFFEDQSYVLTEGDVELDSIESGRGNCGAIATSLNKLIPQLLKITSAFGYKYSHLFNAIVDTEHGFVTLIDGYTGLVSSLSFPLKNDEIKESLLVSTCYLGKWRLSDKSWECKFDFSNREIILGNKIIDDIENYFDHSPDLKLANSLEKRGILSFLFTHRLGWLPYQRHELEQRYFQVMHKVFNFFRIDNQFNEELISLIDLHDEGDPIWPLFALTLLKMEQDGKILFFDEEKLLLGCSVKESQDYLREAFQAVSGYCFRIDYQEWEKYINFWTPAKESHSPLAEEELPLHSSQEHAKPVDSSKCTNVSTPAKKSFSQPAPCSLL